LVKLAAALPATYLQLQTNTSQLDVESGLNMELCLNLAWVLLAASILAFWLRFAPPTGVCRRKQFVVLALLILLLFPVISVTDDLLAAQNPAETDSCLRKDHAVACAHSVFPAASTLPQPAFAGPSFSFLRFTAPGGLPVPVLNHPGLDAVQNRPPPLV